MTANRPLRAYLETYAGPFSMAGQGVMQDVRERMAVKVVFERYRG